jgi:hypothetical protein
MSAMSAVTQIARLGSAAGGHDHERFAVHIGG